MLFRAARWKLSSQDLQAFKQGVVSLSRRRTFTKRQVKVDVPAPIEDQREMAFCYFTLIPKIDLKRKNKPGYHLKKSNNFLAWLGVRANGSSAAVCSGVSASAGISASTGFCASAGINASTEVCAAMKYTTPNRPLVVSKESVSKINDRMMILDTIGDSEVCTSLKSDNFRMRADDSSAAICSGVGASAGFCASAGINASTGVCAAMKYTTPSRPLVVSKESVSNDRMMLLETTGDFEVCTSLKSDNFRPTATMIFIEHDPIVKDCDSAMTRLTRKAIIKQVNSVDIIVEMFKRLSLDDKRKTKETEMEHFETFQAHRPYARPYAKRTKVSNN